MSEQNLSDQSKQDIYTKIIELRKFKTLKICQANNQTDNLNLYNRIKLPFLKKCFAILRFHGASTYASINGICDACNSEMNSNRRLLECKQRSNVRDSFMNKINRLTHFNTVERGQAENDIENHVINDIMKYIKTIRGTRIKPL